MLGSLRNEDGNYNATNQYLLEEVWWNFFTLSTKLRREVLMRTWVRSSRSIIHSLPLHCQSNHASESALRMPVFCTTWPTWNNHATLNLTQSPILKRRFRCSTFNSLLFISISRLCGWGIGERANQRVAIRRKNRNVSQRTCPSSPVKCWLPKKDHSWRMKWSQ